MKLSLVDLARQAAKAKFWIIEDNAFRKKATAKGFRFLVMEDQGDKKKAIAGFQMKEDADIFLEHRIRLFIHENTE